MPATPAFPARAAYVMLACVSGPVVAPGEIPQTAATFGSKRGSIPAFAIFEELSKFLPVAHSTKSPRVLPVGAPDKRAFCVALKFLIKSKREFFCPVERPLNE